MMLVCVSCIFVFFAFCQKVICFKNRLVHISFVVFAEFDTSYQGNSVVNNSFNKVKYFKFP